ncbi:MAG: hypothetical protein Q4B80_01475 [Aerococcaceae bacterium]|nr:hypothetical protein [Aerococcaceae bacterium]
MAIKDKDFLSKQEKNIDERMRDLGVELVTGEETEWEDPMAQFLLVEEEEEGARD